jgi:beta-lactam-binding protein with PASTA domain/tRNA A-37 threonylcarbamoyl transferase component Bud32
METTAGQISGDAASSLVGRLLDGRYRLDSVIARGGMATVYLATDTRLDRAVAVKVMHRALADDPEFVARFTREAKASARLSSAEVVAVHDYGTDRETGLAYLVMEHVRGINLRQLLQERGALPPARAVSLLEPVLRALAAAHAAGLVHRDIKPENVLLADDGRVKVADFGLARAVETSNLTQTTGLLIGTVAYLAPEQVESGTADARTDVYAAGVLFWELLTGTPPYAGESPLSVAYRHVHEDVPPPSTAVEGIPATLDALVVRATRRDPGSRPVDGGAFLAELREVAEDLPTAPTTVQHKTLVVPRVAAAQPSRARPATAHKRRGLVGVVGLLVLALLALGGGFYLGSFRYTNAPGVLKLSLADATKKLETAGLKVKQGDQEFSEDVEKGLVLRQNPRPGGRVRKGGDVTVVLSKGKDRRRVPRLIGSTVPAAQKALQDVGLTAAPNLQSEYSDTVPRDAVIRSDPAAGAGLKRDSVVTLFVSKGRQPVAVPDVRGKKLSDAKNKLEKADFQVTVTEVFSDTVDKDVVVDQSPSTGTADKGSTVTLTVSKGPDVVAVPDVRGDSPEKATRKLQDLGLKAGRVDIPGGSGSVVFSTDPGRGKKVKRGTTVTLYVI